MHLKREYTFRCENESQFRVTKLIWERNRPRKCFVADRKLRSSSKSLQFNSMTHVGFNFKEKVTKIDLT